MEQKFSDFIKTIKKAKNEDEPEVPEVIETISVEIIDYKVDIKQEYLNELPFGAIQSRNAIAITWSFFGDRLEVGWFMQKLSHKTRAYFVKADFLKGFLVPCNIIKTLQNFSLGVVISMNRHQTVQYGPLIEKLKSLKKLMAKTKYLQQYYPMLSNFLLRDRQDIEFEMDEYFSKCKSYENDHLNYSHYVHGFLNMAFEVNLVTGQLKEGKLMITIPGFDYPQSWSYEGFVNEQGRPTGKGQASDRMKCYWFYGTWFDGLPHGLWNTIIKMSGDSQDWKYKGDVDENGLPTGEGEATQYYEIYEEAQNYWFQGTWLAGKPHGNCIFGYESYYTWLDLHEQENYNRYDYSGQGEYKNGQVHGKQTITYLYENKTQNQLFKEGKLQQEYQISNPELAYYADYLPLKAFDEIR